MGDVPFDSSLGFSGGRSLEDALTRWTADARIDERAQERLRERWLRQQADEDTTFAGTLVDLAERGRPVGLHTAAGRQHRGTIIAVGADFFLLRTLQHLDVLVPFDAVSYVRPQPGEAASFGDRALTIDVLFTEALHELSADRPRVLVVLRGVNQSVAGVLRSVGRDVVSLGLDGSDRTVASLPIVSIAEVAST
jgi:hypothetical protein